MPAGYCALLRCSFLNVSLSGRLNFPFPLVSEFIPGRFRAAQRMYRTHHPHRQRNTRWLSRYCTGGGVVLIVALKLVENDGVGRIGIGG